MTCRDARHPKRTKSLNLFGKGLACVFAMPELSEVSYAEGEDGILLHGDKGEVLPGRHTPDAHQCIHALGHRCDIIVIRHHVAKAKRVQRAPCQEFAFRRDWLRSG